MLSDDWGFRMSASSINETGDACDVEIQNAQNIYIFLKLSQAFFNFSQNHPNLITIPKGQILRGRGECTCSVCLSFFLGVGIDRNADNTCMLGELVRLR